MMNFFKILYTLLIGIVYVFVIGSAIAVFYPQPAYPAPLPAPTPQQSATISQNFTEKLQTYHQRVAIILLIISLLTMGVGYLLRTKNMPIGQGIVFGGVFTLIYSFTTSLDANNTKLSFAISLIGFIVVIALGYFVFLTDEGKR